MEVDPTPIPASTAEDASTTAAETKPEASAPEVQPSETIYVQNINERVKTKGAAPVYLPVVSV